MMSEEDEDVLFDRAGVLVVDEQRLLPDEDDVNDVALLESPVHMHMKHDTTVIASKGRVYQTICLCAAFFGLVSTDCIGNTF